MDDMPLLSTVAGKSLDLLAQAALAPQDQAAAAWRQWRSIYDLDTTPWGDVRMLAAIAGRISTLEPGAPVGPRIAGIRKFLWVQSQICLQHAAAGLDALRRRGVPVLLMKGAARIASDPASAQERLVRDVDVLVPLDRHRQAFELLRDEGWHMVPEAWQIAWHRWSPVAAHHAWSMRKGRSEIDLHHFSNHLNRLRGDDDGLWDRSLALEWRGVPVRVPSPADALLLALTHGVRWSPDYSADWAVDASALVDSGNVDWDVFLAEARSRILQGVVFPGLAYLRDVLRKTVPPGVLESLRAEVTPEQCAELKQYVSTAIPFTVPQTSVALSMALKRFRTRAPWFDGESGGAGRRQEITRSSAKLTAGNRKCDVQLPSRLDGPGWIAVEVTLAGPDGVRLEPVACTVTAPGLTLGVLAGTRLYPQRPDSPQVMVLTVPESFLDLREIRELRFFFKNYRGVLSLTLSVSRDG